MSNILLPFGRMRRIYYWLFSFALTFVGNVAGEAVKTTTDVAIPAVIIGIFLWPAVMIGIQRAHDIGSRGYAVAWPIAAVVLGAGAFFARTTKPGANPALGMAMLAALLVVVVLNLLFLFKKGQIGSNSYGVDPRARTTAQTVG